MGKKSRKPKRNKPKDIPVPRQVTPSAADDLETYLQLIESQDWEEILELESKMSAFANTSESSDPTLAAVINLINYSLGAAHKEMSREGGIEQASVYFKKSVELAKKAGDNEILTKGVLHLFECYIKMGRVGEAMDLHKSLCDEIGKESMDPSNILEFVQTLKDNHEPSRALEILEEHLDNIERSWEKREQCLAYDMIALLYCKKNDFAKSNVYFKRQLSIAKETKNMELEASALNGLGLNNGCMGEYGNAMAYL